MIKETELKPVVTGMVRAIKDGIVNDFSQRSWDLMRGGRDGWMLFSDITEADEIPTEKIELGNSALDAREADLLKREKEFEAKIKALETEVEPTETDEVSIDTMKAYLADKGVKVHHKAGDAKIKEMYDENRE